MNGVFPRNFMEEFNLLLKDLTNKKFGRLTVIEHAGRNKRKAALWKCRCDCNNESVVCGVDLRNGHTMSCGCLRREATTTHGQHSTPAYQAYQDAKQRCTNSRTRNWSNYGGRGIKFRFRSFQQFLLCVGPKPSPDYVLDRIDVNGDYETGNVRWVTKPESSRNTRRAKLNEAKVCEIRAKHAAGGISHAKLAAQFGIGKSTVTQILHNDIWKLLPPKKPNVSVGTDRDQHTTKTQQATDRSA